MIKELVLLLSSVLLVHLAPALPVPEPESTTCDQVVIIVYQNTMHQLGKGEAWHELLSLMIDEYDVNLLVDVSLLETKLKAMDDLLNEMSAEVGVKRPFKHVQIAVRASRSVRRRGQVKPRPKPISSERKKALRRAKRQSKESLSLSWAVTWGASSILAPISSALQNVIWQITQQVAESNKIYNQNLYDQELELEDNESRVERAISALRFDLINFVLAGDDIAEDIKESRTALGNSRKKDSQCNCIDCTDV
jgi:hypothetical protein